MLVIQAETSPRMLASCQAAAVTATCEQILKGLLRLSES
jgi:hypothetical protein